MRRPDSGAYFWRREGRAVINERRGERREGARTRQLCSGADYFLGLLVKETELGTSEPRNLELGTSDAVEPTVMVAFTTVARDCGKRTGECQGSEFFQHVHFAVRNLALRLFSSAGGFGFAGFACHL